jgi:hypothetical protein
VDLRRKVFLNAEGDARSLVGCTSQDSGGEFGAGMWGSKRSKIRTSGKERSVELYEFLLQHPGMSSLALPGSLSIYKTLLKKAGWEATS